MIPEAYSALRDILRTDFGFDLACYSEAQMGRRLDAWLVRSGAADWPSYLAKLGSEAAERERLRGYLTINVTSFFRDPERWETLRKDILPELAKPLGSRGLRVWSAGCSTGAEAFGLATLAGEVGTPAGFRVLATDIDRDALAVARRGGPYRPDDVRTIPEDLRAKLLEPGGPPHVVHPALLRIVEFREHDLLSSDFETGFDLIACRNVVIYLTQQAKDRLYARFRASLRPGGILFVGGTEVVLHAEQVGLRPHGFGFYRAG